MKLQKQNQKQKNKKEEATKMMDVEELRKRVYNTVEKEIDKVLDYRKDIGKIYIH